MLLARGSIRSAALAAAILAVGTAAAVVGPLPSLHAQSAGAPPEAIERYRQAREHFEAGRYRDAATALERAVELDPDSPTLVYNLARVYELMGELDQALVQYERYQLLLPQQQAREQEQAEATIRRLHGARENTTEDPEPPPREVEPLRQLPGTVLVRQNGVADGAFYAVLAGGIVAAAAGAIFGGLALDASNRTEGFVLGPDGGPQQRDDLHQQALAFGIATDVSLGVGALAVVVAALLYFMREHTVERAPIGAGEEEPADEPSARLDVSVDGASASLTVGGAF